MTNIRRYYSDGYVYFITSVTNDRKPILVDNIDMLWEATNKVKDETKFELIAWAILPEHFHFVMKAEGSNPSQVLKKLKLSFSKKHKMKSGDSSPVWQHRFWDHVIRDEGDLKRHIGYTHLNPIKHGLVLNPFDYRHSSIDPFADLYEQNNWRDMKFDGDFGE